MRSARVRATVAGVSMVAAVGFALPASAGLLDMTDDHLDELLDRLGGTCEAAVEVPASLLPQTIDLSACDLRGTVVRAGALTVRVPLADRTGARAASVVTDEAPLGTVTGLSVVNTGRRVIVDVMRLGEKRTRPALRPLRAQTTACSAKAHAYLGTRNDALQWHLNAATTPSDLQPNIAAQAIIDGAGNLARGANDCGLRPLTGVTQDYQGTTSRRVNCQGPDGQSTVDFGARPEETLATACWWYTAEGATKSVFEADIRFQDNPDTFYTIQPLRCRERYALTGIATHEFGHAFGLAHVSEERFPHQSMSPAAPSCSYDQMTLGRGDWLGLRGLYG